MNDRFDAVALGELLMDLTVNGESAQGDLIFEADPRGAPCNVLAMLRKEPAGLSLAGRSG